ncbi:sarcosine oxidase subunit alpha family protein [Caulobacter soli]|uniref:sarcosine oxidase subunit alpha family protein n=1 Tax=Caulobacter soli TaxID=2708539 RepID=UPI0013EC51B5|nr:sarcosine oxidase subunit alpha family protein [Caulobacter soli]
MSGRRLPRGGLIDRGRVVNFEFEGRKLKGFAGDTLASALLANGVKVVGRSFKYHRPRGLLAAGVEEASALMQVGEADRSTPNPRATEIELTEGLVARPVNCWPSVRFDVGAVNNLLSRFIPAGFYYKTFMWPDWHLFEPFIRKAAGLGRASQAPDPDRYEHQYAHCDVLVVGSGPAGLAAALAAGRRKARVILVEQDTELGGSVLSASARIDGQDGIGWLDGVKRELGARADVQVLTRTTALGYFDHNSLTLLQRLDDHPGRRAPKPVLRQRLWTVRAKQVILATGALERPLVFPGNDVPGVMLASAVRQYLNRWAVLPGQATSLFTNNDSAYGVAQALLDAGAEVPCLIDSRKTPPATLVKSLSSRGVKVITDAVVTKAHGDLALEGVTVREWSGRLSRVHCDVLAMSGGWNPTVHLFSQSGGKLGWDDQIAAFRPDVSVQAEVSVGAANGQFALGTALSAGWAAGGGTAEAPAALDAAPVWTIEPLWRVQAPGKAFVDFQHDVTAADIALAKREAFVSVEHLKRYTTLGMAPDQGKTSNVNALAIMSELTGQSVAQAGTTRFRFPFTPLSLAALGGQTRGDLFRPYRRLPTHERQAAAGAVFEDYGGWLRPAYYPKAGESPHAAEQREAQVVRQAVGIFEGSPLGKIEVVGPDAAEFLDRIYANTMSTLKAGRARYGLMLNELGVLIDDGVTLRLDEERFLVGTTGGGADRIAAWLEEWLQCEWRDLKVLVAPISTAWGVLTLSGPRAREVLAAAGVDFPIGPEDFPHMTFKEGHVGGVPARVVRASFTGEVTYEVNVPADRSDELWDRLTAAGAPFGLTPVGIDAWMVLRTEKGFLHIGADTDGTTSPVDVGWGTVLKRKHDFVGRRSLTRPDNLREDRLQFVGLELVGSTDALPIGAHLRGPGVAEGSEGFVTSAGFSPALGRGVALGMVRGGQARHGEELEIVTGGLVGQRVRITKPGVYDIDGERLNG